MPPNYDINTLPELVDSVTNLYDADPDIFEEFTLLEVLEDGLQAGLYSKELMDEYINGQTKK